MKIYLFLLIVLIFSDTYGQRTAITEDGQKIVVYNNGTWKNKEQSIELNFFNKRNNNGEMRLFLNVNGRYYDIYHWFKYNDKNWISYGVQSVDIINKNSSKSQKDIYASELKKYGTYATYHRGGGIDISFFPVVENGVVKVYKVSTSYIMIEDRVEETKELLKTFKL